MHVGERRVSCSSASACTAVGYTDDGNGNLLTLAERWNGRSWTVQPTPNPNPLLSVLSGVSCTAASACTAVGDANGATLAERWNGTSWAIQPTPKPTGASFSFLLGVSCTSASACTAVGSYSKSTGTEFTLAERYG